MQCTIMYYGYKIKIINIYAPTEDKPMAKNKTFLQRSLKAFRGSPEGPEEVSTSTPRRLQCDGICYHNLQHQLDLDYNENGELFIDLLRDFKLFNLNTAFVTRPVRRYTRITSYVNKNNQIIDYINCNSNLRRLAMGCRVFHSIITHDLSDHRIVIATFRIPTNKTLIKVTTTSIQRPTKAAR